MKTKLVISFALIAGLLAVCSSLSAHHGSAAYDNTKVVVLKNATVTKVNWGNPHILVMLDAKDDKGNVVHWTGEIAPNPTQLQQDGWGRKRSEAALAPGTEVTITLAPSRLGTPVALVQKIVNSKGEAVLGAVGLGAPPPTEQGKQ